MGLNIDLGAEFAFNPNINPLPMYRAYPGITSGLLGAWQFDNSPAPLTPVAGAATAPATVTGDRIATARGVRLSGNAVIDTGIVPGSGLAAFTIWGVLRRTGMVPDGAVSGASPLAIGPTDNAAFRLDMQANYVFVNNLIADYQSNALDGDTRRWDFYAFSCAGTGTRLYRPRIQATPVTSAVTIADIGATQLNSTFRIGTAGTAIAWAEAEVMSAGLFNRKLSDAEVLDQYEAMQEYALVRGVTL